MPPNNDDRSRSAPRKPPPPPGFARRDRGTAKHVAVRKDKADNDSASASGSKLPRPGSLPKPPKLQPPKTSAKPPPVEAPKVSKPTAPPKPPQASVNKTEIAGPPTDTPMPPRPPPPAPAKAQKQTQRPPPPPPKKPRARHDSQAPRPDYEAADALGTGPDVDQPPTVAVPGKAASKTTTTLLDAYAEDAGQALARYEAMLAEEKDARRLGRLHYEIARLCERGLGLPEKAATHYSKALNALPDFLPVIVGARRLLLARGQYEKALDLFDRQIRVTEDRDRRAALMFAKARVLEDHLGRRDQARDIYAAAADLSESDPVLLKALEEVDLAKESWEALGEVIARTANAVSDDTKHRAHLMAQRARLLEVHGRDSDSAVELYEAALGVDKVAAGAIDALKRLHFEHKRWRELVGVLEREADAADDPVVRIMAYYRAGQIQAERLGNRKEAIALLERAAEQRPVQSVVLEALARLYEAEGHDQALADTLSRLVESTDDLHERLGYLHRIGELCRDRLDDPEAAVRAYEAALAIEPGYIPALRALAPMYAAAENYEALVHMHEAEAEAAHETPRRATAHVRAAEILERMGRVVEATTHHEHALALDPSLDGSFRALVRLLTAQGEHHKLVELYERAIDGADEQRRIEYLFAIGDLYRGPLDDPDQAEHTFKRVLAEKPGHLGAVHALQRTAEAASRYKSLVEALDLEADIIDDEKEIVQLLHRAAELCYEQLGDRNGAVRRFKTVLDLDSHHVPTLASLGRIHHAERHWADLVDVYERELEVTPQGPAAVALLHKMGELYAHHLAQPDRAIECFRKALDLDPRHGPTVHALARILRDRKHWEELVKLAELERDSFKDPASRALASYRAGELYETHLEMRIDAERCYAEALQIRPGLRPAADALARVRSHLEHWKDLAQELEADADTLADASLAISTLMRAAQVWWDHLQSADQATRCYEKVLERNSDHLGALLALEPLYRRLSQWAKLAAVYQRQVLVTNDDGAKVAALTERARLLELHDLGSTDDLIDCYTAILAIRPGDTIALAGLERLALAAEDPRVLASVDARIAANTTDTTLRGAYLTRQAESLEQSGQPQALSVYREALRCDPESRAALRGMSRLAEVLGDAEAMVEAARGAANIARNPKDAADAWVRSGTVRVEHLGDEAGAIEDFERALAAWPDHEQAARRLSASMREHGQFEALVERLGRAAAAAKDRDRQSALWIEVAGIHAEDLRNLGAALASLQRLIKVQPDNALAHLELGRSYVGDRRHDEAIGALRKCLKLTRDDAVLRDANVLLGTAYESTDDVESAFRCFEKALEKSPEDPTLLLRLVQLQMRNEKYAEAADIGRRLLDQSRDEHERAAALRALAQAHAGQGQNAEAIDALAEAVALDGPTNELSKWVAKIAGDDRALWGHYVEGLQRYVSKTAERVPFDLEIARVLFDRLGAADRGMQVLAEGLRASKGDGSLRFEMAKRLRAAGRLDDAVEQFQYLLMDDVARVEAWRYLAQTLEELGRARERVMTLAALAVMQEASPGELDEVRAWQPRTSALRAGSFAPGAASDLFVAREHQAPAAALLSAICDGLGKVRPADLSRWGVGSRDKIAARSDHPLRALVDHLAAVFGVEEFELYLHRNHELGVGVENTSKPSLMLPLWLTELPRSQQVFLIAQQMVNLARGVYVVDLFTARELEVVLAAATRTHVTSFGGNIASAEVLDDQARLVARGIPRRKRKTLEAAAETFARSRAIQTATLVQWVRQTARRVALVVSDDLIGTTQILRQLDELPDDQGIALVRNSAVMADLLKVWVSRPAMALRMRGGLLTGPAAQPAAS